MSKKKCIGCGVLLQAQSVSNDGFVSSNDYNLCERCFRIKHYGENKVVNKNNIDYMNILNKITDNDLVIYVSSLLTVNLDYLSKFKNVILVLTKRDIMPKSIKNEKIVKYIKERYNNLLDILLVSSYKKINLDLLFEKMSKYGKNKKIYFVGSTNSGKSSLINQLSLSFGEDEFSEITTSVFPSTTLDVISLNIKNLKIYDTPGIVIEDSIINFMNNSEMKKINSKKEIKPITFQISGAGSILVDDYLRIDYETEKSSMTFYMSNNLNIRNASLNNKTLYTDNIVEFNNIINKDVVIEDLGFVKITNLVSLKIYYNNSVLFKVRDNLI